MRLLAILSALLAASATDVSAAHAQAQTTVPGAEFVPAAVSQTVVHFASGYEVSPAQATCPPDGITYYFTYAQHATIVMSDGSRPIKARVYTDTVIRRGRYEVSFIFECEGFRVLVAGNCACLLIALENAVQNDPNDAFRFRTVE